MGIWLRDMWICPACRRDGVLTGVSVSGVYWAECLHCGEMPDFEEASRAQERLRLERTLAGIRAATGDPELTVLVLKKLEVAARARARLSIDRGTRYNDPWSD